MASSMNKLILFARGMWSRYVGASGLAKYVGAIAFVALASSVVVTHQAHATFFAPRANTWIYGTDKLQGVPLGRPSASSTADEVSTLYVDPGDTVGWNARRWNAGDLGGGTTATMVLRTVSSATASKNGVAGTDSTTTPIGSHVWGTNLFEEINIILANGLAYYYNSTNTDITNYNVATYKIPVGSEPGTEYCQYVKTNPKGIVIIPGVGAPSSTPGWPLQSVPFTIGGTLSFIPGATVAPLQIVPPFFAVTAPDSVWSCAVVAYDYKLTPTIDIPNLPAAGTPVQVNLSVTNKSNRGDGYTPTQSQLTQWQVTQFSVPKTETAAIEADNAAISDTNPSITTTSDLCTYFQGKYPIDMVPVTNARGQIIGYTSTCAISTNGSNSYAVQSNNGSGAANKVSGCPSSSNHMTTVFGSGGEIKSDLCNQAFPSSLKYTAPASGSSVMCYVLSVSSYKPVYGTSLAPQSTKDSRYASSATWNNSKIVCPSPSAAVHPTTQILGDDLHVGGDILTSQPNLASAVASWAQYAAYAAGASKCFASASDADTIKAATSQAALNTLTFANVTGSGTCPSTTGFGSFTDASTLMHGATTTHDSLVSQAASLTDEPGSVATADLSNASTFPQRVNRKSYNPTTAPLTIQSATDPTTNPMVIPAGKTIIIVSKKPVTIGSNIIYASDTGDNTTLTTIADIPQVIIVAPSITIGKDVTQVDAWLVTDVATDTVDANGDPVSSGDGTTHYINTCSQAAPAENPTGLTTGPCDKPLTVNGPVMTSHLYLNRTTDPTTGPAETFDNRGDAYLWAIATASANPTLTTTLQRELPPRF